VSAVAACRDLSWCGRRLTPPAVACARSASLKSPGAPHARGWPAPTRRQMAQLHMELSQLHPFFLGMEDREAMGTQMRSLRKCAPATSFHDLLLIWPVLTGILYGASDCVTDPDEASGWGRRSRDAFQKSSQVSASPRRFFGVVPDSQPLTGRDMPLCVFNRTRSPLRFETNTSLPVSDRSW
jgi:hypothetical protein